MKTLDEVIDIMEHPLYGADDGFAEIAEDDLADALHYLRELQLFRETPVMQGIHKAQEEYATYPVEDWNPALTWEQLKQMEGKPVWLVNTATEEAEWVLVGEWLDDDEMRICRMWQDDADYIIRELYGDTWQAYRKERK